MLLKSIVISAVRISRHRPYINHPITLVDILVNEGEITDLDTLLAALLHDTIEDTDATVEEIQAEFGPTIASLVMEVTDDGNLAAA